ncbi:MAG: helix-turn-helix domain-containing protein [Oscillospiraceae bacterium]|jgi:transcriptional regulator with XRE-family HTH domain|nr:helix-turn-helix domain-containing protein [Oscillospiraceae bacterium]
MTIEIANRLVNLRKENKLSQEELAEKLGISRQAVSKWERAESSPDTDNLIRLAKLYNVSLDKLLSISEELPPPEVIENTVEKKQDEIIIKLIKDKADYEVRKALKVRNENTHPKEEYYSWIWLDTTFAFIVTLVYLIIGFCFDIWHPTWLIFLTIPIYYIISGTFHARRVAKKAKATIANILEEPVRSEKQE